MRRPDPKRHRLLAIALSSRGLGYAVIEGEKFLVDYGNMSVKGDKNRQCLARTKRLFELYLPDLLVLQDVTAKGSHRAPRIKTLNQQIIETASKRRLRVALFSGKQLRNILLGNIRGTKYEVAQLLAKRFPDELTLRLPPKRRPWESADARMDTFDAVALAVAFRMREGGNVPGEIQRQG